MKSFQGILALSIGMLLVGTFLNRLSAQQILLDKPVRAGELTLFPTVQNPNEYYYLPDKVVLSKHANGKPQFSFIRYVKNEPAAGPSEKSIRESTEGGGIIHCLVELNVSDEQRRDAERALQRIYGNAKIVGPVIYKSGTVALISSVANAEGEMTKKIVGLGSAPILEGQKAAVSVMLNKIGSKILWETFQTPTPDFSMAFEMEVEGFLSPKRVLIEADFERVYKHQGIEAAAVTPVLAAEIKATLDELYDSGAIKVTQIGNDEQLDKMRETAYNQLINLMFDKIGGTGVPQLNQLVGGNRPSMLDRATTMLDKARKEALEENKRLDQLRRQQAQRESQVRTQAQQARDRRFAASGRRYIPPTEGQRRPATQPAQGQQGGEVPANYEVPQDVPVPSLAIAVSYQLKKIRRTGTYKIDLNKYTETNRTMSFAENVSVRNCPDCFREVNLDDPLMKQRDVTATLSGMNAQDFSKYINFVNVIMRKEHQNGEMTVDEVKIDNSKFNQTGNIFNMVYGWKGDTDRERWLEFEYRTLWSFHGGYSVETDWQSTEFGSIALAPPFVKKPVYIEADPDFIYDEEIRGVEITVYSKLGEKVESQRVNLKTDKEELSRTAEILIPLGQEEFEYEITWYIKGQDPRTTSRRATKAGMLYLDRFL